MKCSQARLITFGGGTGAVGGDLTHAPSVAAQRHEPGDDGRLPVPDAAHHDGAVALGGLAGLQDAFQVLKEPVAAHEHRVGGDAGNLEEQRLEHDIHRFVGSEARWEKGKEMKAIKTVYPAPAGGFFFFSRHQRFNKVFLLLKCWQLRQDKRASALMRSHNTC